MRIIIYLPKNLYDTPRDVESNEVLLCAFTNISLAITYDYSNSNTNVVIGSRLKTSVLVDGEFVEFESNWFVHSVQDFKSVNSEGFEFTSLTLVWCIKGEKHD